MNEAKINSIVLTIKWIFFLLLFELIELVNGIDLNNLIKLYEGT